MFSQSLRRWFAPARPIRRRQCRLLLEPLESRLNLSAVGGDFRISHFGPDGDPAFVADAPAVAYNSTDDEYLVVWAGDGPSGSEIYGQRLDAATRRPVGAEIVIDTPFIFGSNVDPAVAYNSTWNEYLVVWTGTNTLGHEVFGQRLGASGELVAYLQISDTFGTRARTPAVAYNSANNQYLVVWEGQYNLQSPIPGFPPIRWESEIFGQQLGPAGIELGVNDFRISSIGPDGSFDYEANDPAVVYNSADNHYLVAWSADDDAGVLVDDEFEIYGQRFDASPETFGEIGLTDFRISNIGTSGDPTFDALHPALAYNSANNEYLVVWDGNAGTDAESAFEIYGQRLSGATGLGTGVNDFRISDAGPEGDGNFDATSPAADYNRATNRYVVVWSGDDDIAPLVNDELEIFGQTLDANPDSFGQIGLNDFRISSMGPNGDPAFAALAPALASSHSEFLAVWSGDDNSGDLVNDEFEIFGSRVGSTDRPEVFFDPATRELLLYGSNQADGFHLSADVQGNIVITSAGKTVVPIDSASGQTQSPSLSNTESIKGLLRDGEDRFDFVGDGFQGIAVEIIGEDGNDSLTFHSPDKPAQGEQLASFLFNGGDGSDTFQLITTELAEEISLMSELEEFDIPCDALRIRDLATDAILAEVMAEDAENIVVESRGGADAVTATVDWTGAVSPTDLPQKRLSYLFNLGDGDDSLEFSFASERADIGLDIEVHGGRGDETIETALNWAGIVTPTDLPPPVNATFVLGDGLNTLQLDLNSEVSAGLNLRVDGGKDDDAIEAALNWAGIVTPSDLPSPVNATFVLGAGGDALHVDFSSEASNTGLKLNVDGGLGSDEVQVAVASPRDVASNQPPTDFVADIAVRLGGDDDTFGFSADSAAPKTLVNLNLDAGSGADDIIIADTSIFGLGNFEINAGFDDDLLLFEQNTFRGLNLNVNAGAGHDFVLVEGNTATGAARLSFNLDAGYDALSLLENAFAQGLTLSVIGGTGFDSIAYESNAVTGAAKLDFNLGAGDDRLAIRKSTFQQITLTVRAGAGKDRISLEDNKITGLGKLTIDLGTGKDTFFNRRNKLAKNVTLKVMDPDR